MSSMLKEGGLYKKALIGLAAVGTGVVIYYGLTKWKSKKSDSSESESKAEVEKTETKTEAKEETDVKQSASKETEAKKSDSVSTEHSEDSVAEPTRKEIKPDPASPSLSSKVHNHSPCSQDAKGGKTDDLSVSSSFEKVSRPTSIQSNSNDIKAGPAKEAAGAKSPSENFEKVSLPGVAATTAASQESNVPQPQKAAGAGKESGIPQKVAKVAPVPPPKPSARWPPASPASKTPPVPESKLPVSTPNLKSSSSGSSPSTAEASKASAEADIKSTSKPKDTDTAGKFSAKGDHSKGATNSVEKGDEQEEEEEESEDEESDEEEDSSEVDSEIEVEKKDVSVQGQHQGQHQGQPNALVTKEQNGMVYVHQVKAYDPVTQSPVFFGGEYSMDPQLDKSVTFDPSVCHPALYGYQQVEPESENEDRMTTSNTSNFSMLSGSQVHTQMEGQIEGQGHGEPDHGSCDEQCTDCDCQKDTLLQATDIEELGDLAAKLINSQPKGKKVDQFCSQVHVHHPEDASSYIELGVSIRTIEEKADTGMNIHRIESIAKDSFAQEIGLKVNDELIEVNRMDISHWSHEVLLQLFTVISVNDFELVVSAMQNVVDEEGQQVLNGEGHVVQEEAFCQISASIHCERGEIGIKSTVVEKREVSMQLKDVLILPDAPTCVEPCWLEHQASSSSLACTPPTSLQLQPLQQGTKPAVFQRVFYAQAAEVDEAGLSTDGLVVLQSPQGSIDHTISACVVDHTSVSLMAEDKLMQAAVKVPDCRFFSQHSFGEWVCWESTQLADHYLACQGGRVFLKHVATPGRAMNDPALHVKVHIANDKS